MALESLAENLASGMGFILFAYLFLLFLGLIKNNKLKIAESVLSSTTCLCFFLDFYINKSEKGLIGFVVTFALTVVVFLRTFEWIVKERNNPK